MHTESKRQKQASSVIAQDLSSILLKYGSYLFEESTLVTVTIVRMTPDLEIARVYVSVYNAQDKAQVIKVLAENTKKIRFELGQKIGKLIRKVPQIQFFLDDTLDEIRELDKLFAEIHANAPTEPVVVNEDEYKK